MIWQKYVSSGENYIQIGIDESYMFKVEKNEALSLFIDWPTESIVWENNSNKQK